jgi:nucleoside-diphosphate-sugar epimerase
MKHIVIGGNGFTGRCLVKDLVQQGFRIGDLGSHKHGAFFYHLMNEFRSGFPYIPLDERAWYPDNSSPFLKNGH